MTEGKSKPIWRRLWPKIDDIESAKFATLYGFWGATVFSALTAIFATISLFFHQSIFGLDAWSYIDALLLGIVAWRVKNYSRAFAIGGIALGAGNVIAKLLEPLLYPPSAFAGAIFVLIVYFINGARGVFAYNRFKPTSIWGESSHSGESSKLSGTAPAAETTSTDSATEDKFFEQALTEVESGQMVKTIWAQSLASAEGDLTKAKALYIRFRVDNLKLLSLGGAAQSEIKLKSGSGDSNGGFLKNGFLVVAFVLLVAVAMACLLFRYDVQPDDTNGRKTRYDRWTAKLDILLPLCRNGSQTFPMRWGQPNDPEPAQCKSLLDEPPQNNQKGGILDELNKQRSVLDRFQGDGFPDAPIYQPKEAVTTGAQTPVAQPQNNQTGGLLDDLPDVNADDQKKLAAQGDANAQLILGLMYTEGLGVPLDYAEAAKWYRLAAQQGNASAQLNLGAMYDLGQGVPLDYAEAIKWYRLAAQQGNAKAQSNLGLMYAKGLGVPLDYVRAHLWFNLAATSGNADAIKNRDVVAVKMTSQQIAKAQNMARDCTAKKLKGCN